MAGFVAATIAGVGAVTARWTQERSDRLFRDIDADIRHTLQQHETRKLELAAMEQAAPAFTTGIASLKDSRQNAGQDAGDGRTLKTGKTAKAKIGSIRKRGHRRDRLVPPDFARLPIAVARAAARLQSLSGLR